MSEVAWAIEDLVVRYGALTAVDRVSLRLEQGARVGLVGASGSGKTTLIRAGLGLVRRQSGTIALFGEPTASWGERRWEQARRRAQLLFQDPRAMLHPSIPIGLLLEDSARVHRPDEDAATVAARTLDSVGLGARGDALPHELSGGERRRAGIARLLVARPSLLVVDEPTVGLDAALKADMLALLLDRLDPACAVLLVSHDLAVVRWACDRAAVMARGAIVDTLPTTELDRATNPTTRALYEAAGLEEAS